MPRVFISASAEDRPFVDRLKRDLLAAGVETDTAEDSIQPGESVANRVTKGIESADAVVTLLSKDAAKSSWVSTEIALALARQQHDERRRLIPVLTEPNAPIPFFLRDLLYLDMSSPEKYKALIPRLVNSLKAPAADTDDRDTVLHRRMESLIAERKVLESEKKEYAGLSASRSKTLVSTIASLIVVLAVIGAVTLLHGFHGEWIDKFWIESSALAFITSVISSLLTNFFYRRIGQRHQGREAFDE